MQFLRKLSVLSISILLLTACGSDEATSTRDTVLARSDSSTVTPTPLDPDSRRIPDHPDMAYIEATLASMDRIEGDIRREVFSTQSMSRATLNRIEDIYGPNLVGMVKRYWADESMQDHPNAVDIPGNAGIKIHRVVDTDPGCIVISGAREWNGVYKDAGTSPPKPWIYHLQAYPGDNRSNPTIWKFEDQFEVGLDGQIEMSCGS